jgi:ribulose bisphosphate carboxylase small subunit
VWPPVGKKKFETLSYLPPLTEEQLAKEVEYLIRKGWIPCLEFELEVNLFTIATFFSFLTYEFNYHTLTMKNFFTHTTNQILS